MRRASLIELDESVLCLILRHLSFIDLLILRQTAQLLRTAVDLAEPFWQRLVDVFQFEESVASKQLYGDSSWIMRFEARCRVYCVQSFPCVDIAFVLVQRLTRVVCRYRVYRAARRRQADEHLARASREVQHLQAR